MRSRRGAAMTRRRAGLAVVAMLAAGCEGSARGELSRARIAESRRAVGALLADADRVEARLLLARTLPGECDDALREARSSQRGALLFVRGDHCWVVRELPLPRSRR